MRWPLAIRRWQSQHSLEGIDAPTRVSVTALVASANSVASPVSPVRAALYYWLVFARTLTEGHPATAGQTAFRLVDAGILARELVLSVGRHTVLLPFPGYEVRFRALPEYGEPLAIELPAGMLRAPVTQGMPCYNELPLFQGDRVRLTAVLAPAGQRGAGAYRDGAQTDFVALYDVEPAVVEDQSGEG